MRSVPAMKPKRLHAHLHGSHRGVVLWRNLLAGTARPTNTMLGWTPVHPFDQNVTFVDAQGRNTEGSAPTTHAGKRADQGFAEPGHGLRVEP